MFTTKLFKFCTLAGMLVVPMSSAFAGIPVNGTMTYRASAATEIPTLSGAMLILLSLLLLAVAVRVARQKNSGANKMFVTLLGATALSFGGGGIKLVSDAEAVGMWIMSLPLPLNSDNTGSVEIKPGYNLFTNIDPMQRTITITGLVDPTTDDPDYECGMLSAAKTAAALPATPSPVNLFTCAVGLQIPYQDGCEYNCPLPDTEIITDLEF